MAYVVLSFFVTDTYDDPRKPNKTTSYSHFDPALRAEGPTYMMYRIYAAICVATHVFGIPAFFAVCLHRVRDHLDPLDSEGSRPRIDPQKPGESRARCAAIAHTRVNDPELRALRPLWFVYLPQYYNFEVLELLRRMVMMTLPKLASQNPVTQIAFTCLIAYASTRLYRKVQPFLSASDCEFYENIQWLTLILSSIVFYTVADQRHDQFVGYAIILLFILIVIHATVLVAFDIRQERFVVDAIQEYMSKVRCSFLGHRAMSHRPHCCDNLCKGIAHMDNSRRGNAVNDSGDGGDDVVEFRHTVAKLKSPSKIADAANVEAEPTSDETAKSPSLSN